MSWRKLLFPWLQDRLTVAENQFSLVDVGLGAPGSQVLATGFFVPERTYGRAEGGAAH